MPHRAWRVFGLIGAGWLSVVPPRCIDRARRRRRLPLPGPRPVAPCRCRRGTRGSAFVGAFKSNVRFAMT